MPRLFRSLYFQVLIAVATGALLGHFRPALAVEMKPLGDGFIKLVKMLIAPIVFATVVSGIAHMGDLKKVGRVGLKAFVYFEVVTTLAMLVGLLVGNVVGPGRGLNVRAATLDTRGLDGFTNAGHQLSATEFVLNVIPSTVVDAFAKGEILQVLLVSVLFGAALAAIGARVAPLVALVDQVGQAFFAIVAFVMRVAPIGAFGAMAFTIGKYGVGTLASLGKLMLTFYATSVVFIVAVLGLIAWRAGINIFLFLRYIREEIFIVLGTSSSESALPRLMAKLEALGCGKSVVGLVVPMGYSFNLDGTSIYLTMATLFMAQAMNIPLPLGQELVLLGVLLLTSKGAAAVTGGGFVTLAATLSATGPIPVSGLALLLGIDRFMSEARAITNLIGNGVATVALARLEGELNLEQARRILRHSPPR